MPNEKKFNPKRDSKGHFLPGQGGRPKGAVSCDKSIAIRAIFKLFGKPSNQKLFKQKLQETFEADPLVFYKNFIEPLQDSSSITDDDKELIIRIGK